MNGISINDYSSTRSCCQTVWVIARLREGPKGLRRLRPSQSPITAQTAVGCEQLSGLLPANAHGNADSPGLRVHKIPVAMPTSRDRSCLDECIAIFHQPIRTRMLECRLGSHDQNSARSAPARSRGCVNGSWLRGPTENLLATQFQAQRATSLRPQINRRPTCSLRAGRMR